MVFILRRGSVPYCCSNNINSTEVSLSDILFSFMLEKCTVFDVCGLRSLSFESSNVLYITFIYIYVYDIYNLFHAGINNARNVTQKNTFDVTARASTQSEGWGFQPPSGRCIFCLKNFDTFTKTPDRVSKINAVVRAQLTFQMLTLHQNIYYIYMLYLQPIPCTNQ